MRRIKGAACRFAAFTGILAFLILASGYVIRAAANDVVTLRLAGSLSPEWEPVYQASIAAFESKHPHIKVDHYRTTPTYDELIVDLVAGTGPDIFVFNSFETESFHVAGLTMSLNEFIQRDNYDLSDFFPPMIEDFTSSTGDLVALPYDASTIVMFYNTSLFVESGIETPTNAMTWNEMLESARKVTRRDGAGNPTVFGVDGSGWRSHWTFPAILRQNGGQLLSDDVTSLILDSPQNVEAIQWWADLALVHEVAPRVGDPFAGAGGFLNGKVGMYPACSCSGRFWLPQISDRFEMNVSYVPAGKARATAMAGGGFAISSQTKHPEEAWEFLKYWMGPEEGSLIWNSARMMHLGVPSRRSALPAFEEGFTAFIGSGRSMRDFRVFIDSVAFAETVPNVPFWRDLGRIVTQGLAPVWAGEAPAESQVAAIVAQANAMIREELARQQALPNR